MDPKNHFCLYKNFIFNPSQFSKISEGCEAIVIVKNDQVRQKTEVLVKEINYSDGSVTVSPTYNTRREFQIQLTDLLQPIFYTRLNEIKTAEINEILRLCGATEDQTQKIVATEIEKAAKRWVYRKTRNEPYARSTSYLGKTTQGQ